MHEYADCNAFITSSEQLQMHDSTTGAYYLN